MPRKWFIVPRSCDFVLTLVIQTSSTFSECTGHCAQLLCGLSHLIVVFVCIGAQSCLTLCDPMDYSPPGSSVHGTLRAGILEWGAIPSSRGSSHPGIKPVCLTPAAGRVLTASATWETPPDSWGFPGGSEGKASACNVGDLGSTPGSGRFPWRRKWQPTPVFLPGESIPWMEEPGGLHSPRGRKESDTT